MLAHIAMMDIPEIVFTAEPVIASKRN